MRFAAATMLVFLAGCASGPDWTNPANDAADFKADSAYCERFFGGNDRDMEGCLEGKGWRKVK